MCLTFVHLANTFPSPGNHPNIRYSSIPTTHHVQQKILHLNYNGLKNKQTEMLNWLKGNKVEIAAFQKTKMADKSKPGDIDGYKLVKKDCMKDTGGGLAFLEHKSIMFQAFPAPPTD